MVLFGVAKKMAGKTAVLMNSGQGVIGMIFMAIGFVVFRHIE